MDLPWYMLYDEVIVLEGCEPPRYVAVHVLGVLPIQQISVIGEDGDGLFCSSQVWSPIFQGLDYCQ